MKKTIIGLVALSLFLWRCSYLFDPEIEGESPIVIFNDAWQAAGENYPYFAFKRIDWNTVRQRYSARAQSARGDQVLALLHDLLGELKDGHAWFYTRGGKLIKPFTPPRAIKDRKAFSLLTVQQYFPTELASAGNSRFFYGILPGNIGYIYISTFINDQTNWYVEFTNIISRLKDTRGIILDVRHNGGGSDLVANYIVSVFLDQPIEGPLWIDSQGNPLPRHPIPPNPKRRYLRPLALLQNGVCFSAAEGFINVMRELPRVTTIGDTTAGGSGAPEDFRIAGGFIIHIPTKAQLNYNGEYIEWNGLAPDVYIPQTEQEINAGTDRQLEYAMNLLNQS